MEHESAQSYSQKLATCPILNQFDLAYLFMTSICKIYFNIILFIIKVYKVLYSLGILQPKYKVFHLKCNPTY
jgi:hypothetical protein